MSVWALWLPIVISGAVVFFASFLAWMVLPHHRSDWSKLSDEDGFKKSLGELNVEPGDYMFPCHQSPEEMKSSEFQQKWKAGPRGLLSVWPEAPGMGLQIGKTFVFYLFASFTVGYLASIGLRPARQASRYFGSWPPRRSSRIATGCFPAPSGFGVTWSRTSWTASSTRC